MVSQIILTIKPYVDYCGDGIVEDWLEVFKDTPIYTKLLNLY